jgi:predicted flap endonuclease-1-like 5' DNA nuclease
LVWWLSRLWGQREEEATVPAIEIKAEPPSEQFEPPMEAEIPEAEAAEVTVEADAPIEEVMVVAAAAEVETRAVEPDVDEPEVEATPDDLTRIEGIGPKISSVLQAAGISTYAQLAASDPDELRQILEESDPRLLRISNPDTWPEQASFAAAGDWDGLKELTSGLKAGRRA